MVDSEIPSEANRPNKKLGKIAFFWHWLAKLISFSENDRPWARVVNLLLFFLITLIIVALVLVPLILQISDFGELILVQALLGGGLFLVLIYSLAYLKRSQADLQSSNERFRLISYATNDVVWNWDLLSDRWERNQSFQRIFGYTAGQIGPETAWWEAQIHPDDRPKVIASLQSIITSGGDFWSGEYRFRRADGTYAHVFDRGYVLHDEQGKPTRMLGAVMDITRWRYIEQELAAERNLLRTLVDLLPDRIYVKDTKARFILKNLADVRIMGAATTDEVVGKTDFDYYPPELANLYFADDQAVIQTGESLLNREEPSIGLNGDSVWISTSKVPVRDSTGQITGLVGIGHDVTERKRIKDALQQANLQLTSWIGQLEQRSHETSLLNELNDLLQTCPSEQEAYTVIGEISRLLFPEEAGRLYILNAPKNLLESVAEWGLSLPDAPVFKPEDCWGLRLGRVHLMERATIVTEKPHDSPLLFCNHIGQPDLGAYLCAPLVAQGEALGLLYFHHFQEAEGESAPEFSGAWYTETRQQLIRTMASSLGLALANLRLRDKLRQQSIRDALTGLFNRRYLEETLAREVLRVDRNQGCLGVIMMDVDHFKRYNDTHGHEAGDLILREMGAFLRSQVRGEDIPCRYGGEEFLLILPGAPLEATRQRAEKLREGIQQMSPFINGQALGSVTVSLGVAIYPQHAASAEAILRAADAALYRAKRAGRNRVMIAEAI